MCIVSYIGDNSYRKYENVPWIDSTHILSPGPSRREFDALKREVEELKNLLKLGKEYDKKNNEPDCEMEEKLDMLRKLAKMVGVDIEEVLNGSSEGSNNDIPSATKARFEAFKKEYERRNRS